MPKFVRLMVFLGLIALMLSVLAVWRAEKPDDPSAFHQAPGARTSVGASTLGHGGPDSGATRHEPPDIASRPQR